MQVCARRVLSLLQLGGRQRDGALVFRALVTVGLTRVKLVPGGSQIKGLQRFFVCVSSVGFFFASRKDGARTGADLWVALGVSALVVSCGRELRVALAGGYSSSMPRLGVPLPGLGCAGRASRADGKPVLGHFVGAQWWSPGRLSPICRVFSCAPETAITACKKKSLPPPDGTVSSSWRGGGPLSRLRTVPLWRPRGLPHASLLAPEQATRVSPSRWFGSFVTPASWWHS